MPFQIHALDPALFAPLFARSDADLASNLARRVIARVKPGFPCRVSLEDAEPGETLILTHFTHQGANSPFRSSHAIFVRENAVRAQPDVGQIPALFSHRLMAVRAFDTAGMMRDADVVDGSTLRLAIERMLADPETAELHLHFARPGCFAARVTRAGRE